jgi:uncharacterized protein YjbI with pentapeptide repeats
MNLIDRDTFAKKLAAHRTWLFHPENENGEQLVLKNAVVYQANAKEEALMMAHFDGVVFLECEIPNASFRKATFINTVFEKSNIQHTEFKEALFENVELKQTNAQGSDFREVWGSSLQVDGGSSLAKADFEMADLPYSKFSQTNCEAAHFKKASLPYSEFHGVQARESNFAESNLNNCVIANTDFSLADMGGSSLHRSRVTKSSLDHALLRGANVDQAVFSQTDILAADTSGTNLETVRIQSMRQKGYAF